MAFSPLIDRLVDALRCLPGVGPKSAQRMAFHLLERGRSGGTRLSDALSQAMNGVRRCESCQNFSDTEVCGSCENPARRTGVLCVVESPSDLLAIEQAGDYKGSYFVLMGHLSPLDGIGPAELELDKLDALLAREPWQELILATNPTVEGDGTALHISNRLAEFPVEITQLARGITTGSVLEFTNKEILADAISGRQPLANPKTSPLRLSITPTPASCSTVFRQVVSP